MKVHISNIHIGLAISVMAVDLSKTAATESPSPPAEHSNSVHQDATIDNGAVAAFAHDNTAVAATDTAVDFAAPAINSVNGSAAIPVELPSAVKDEDTVTVPPESVTTKKEAVCDESSCLYRTRTVLYLTLW